MTEPYHPSTEFVQLLVAATEGELDAAQRADLNALVRDDQAAREYYVEYMNVHTMLELQHQGTPPVTMPLETSGELISPPEGSWRTFFSFAVAASLLLGAMYWGYGQYRENQGYVATWLDGEHVAWEHVGQSQHGSLRPGRGQITSGQGQLELSGGVLIVMQGPAEFELLDDPNRFQFTRGVMRAVVPPGAEGFTVLAAGHEIVDLGTEFGLSVDRYNDVEVHVFAGSVRVDDRLTLTKGESRGISHKGKFYDARREAKSYPSVR